MQSFSLAALVAGTLLGCTPSSNPRTAPAMPPPVVAEASTKAPDFIGTADDWLNSKPLKMKQLRGKVVLVDFWEYTCVNCIRTYPYLNAWWKRYKDKGLVIVGIHTPEFNFAANRDNVESSAHKYGLEFPILLDSQYNNWTAWNNQFWPNKYLIDTKGNVVFEHPGEGGYAVVEGLIQHLLKQRDGNVVLPPIMKEVRASDRPGAVCYPITEEMYAGDRGAQQGQLGFSPREVGVEHDYSLPTPLEEGKFHLEDKWTPESDSLQASGKGSWLAIRYKAKDANVVLDPSAGPVRVNVLQDSKPVRKEDAGDDIRIKGGASYIMVGTPRMYSITHNEKWGKHRLDLEVMGRGLRVYSFTFSSDCQP